MSTNVRFTLAEYDRMIEHMVFDPTRNQRMELIFGEVREMTPPNPPHEDVTDILNRWSTQNTDPEEVRVRIQNSIGVPELDSAPQPDVAWVREQSYRTGRPQPSDVLLIIEVSDSSLCYDRGEKAMLYASAGIADYWIVNVQKKCVEVFPEPFDGEYGEKRTYNRGDTIHPLALPNVSLDVDRLF